MDENVPLPDDLEIIRDAIKKQTEILSEILLRLESIESNTGLIWSDTSAIQRDVSTIEESIGQ